MDNNNKKKNLITGGAGFVGYHLAKRLLDLGEEVVLVDNFFRGKPDKYFLNLLKRPGVKFIKADLTDPKSIKKLGSSYDYVYHLAAINGTKYFYKIPHEVLRINILTLINILDWFIRKNKKKNAKILFTSSNEAYAGALDLFGKLPVPTPESVPLLVSDVYNPRWTYAGTKLIGEQFLIHYANHYKFRMSIVRPHNFYGPRAGSDHVIPELIKRINKKVDPFPIYGVSHTRSFCYIDDAVKAMIMVMESKKTDGRTYHIGTSEELKIRDLAKNLFKVAGWKPRRVKSDSAPFGSVQRRCPEIKQIKKDVGWEPKTKLAEGLKKTYEWYATKT